jgi:predicted phage tail protein
MRTTNHAFVNQFVIYTLLTICLSGSIGLGTVWMRHQISITANANKVLEARLAELKRHLAETNTAIEIQQSPAVLRQRNASMNLGLILPEVQSVTESPTLRLIAKSSRALFDDRAVPVTFRLAAKE